jgi:hypothetical protein
MIQLSLATELGNEKLYECYVDEKGIVKFYLIGENKSDIGTDVLYSIASVQMKQKCDNVIITGYDPPDKRIVRGPYNLFTFAAEYLAENPIYVDPEVSEYPNYWVLGDELGPEACKLYKQGYIEFGKPWLSDESKLSGGGVFNHKEFEKIIGWLYKVKVPFYEQGVTQIELQNKCPRYIILDSFGELQQRSWSDSTNYRPQICLNGDDVDFAKGADLPNSDSKQFLGVREVYIYGYELKNIYPDEKYNDNIEEFEDGMCDFVVDLETTMKEPIKLSAGEDYIVARQGGEGSIYKIIFSCNVSPNWIDKFGGDVDSSNTFRISGTSIYTESGGDPVCEDADNFWGIGNCDGYLRDGKTSADNTTPYYAAIFPMGEGTSGYALDSDAKIVVVYDWDNPCLSILDQRNKAVTKESLETVSVELYAVISKDLPPPIAHCNGGSTTMLDSRQLILDFDVSTVEKIAESEYQKALESLENGDVKIVLPFFGCTGNPWDSCPALENAANFIYELQNDIVESVTYTCKPDAMPVLGEVIDDKTINSINYSYQDSSQYLISVQAGPKWQGVGGWDSSVYQNKVERVQVEGVVRYVYPDNMKCLIQLERIGLLECINGQIDPLEIGDTVKVTVYNNPVSV